MITDKKRVQTKEATEMLVKCYLGVLGELISKFSLKLNVIFMPSERKRQTY